MHRQTIAPPPAADSGSGNAGSDSELDEPPSRQPEPRRPQLMLRFPTPVALRLGVFCFLAAVVATAQTPPVAADEHLAAVVARALAWNPRLAAARAEIGQFAALHRARLGFYDPRLVATGGAAERFRGVPGATTAYDLDNHAVIAQAGIEKAIEPGVYVGIGGGQYYFWGEDADDDHFHETRLGAQLRVPLWRDRGFRLFDLQSERTQAEYEAALARWRRDAASLRGEVTLAYVNLLEAWSVVEVRQAATARVRSLQDEARQLVENAVVAEYQLHTAALEVALREEEEIAARQTAAATAVTLGELTGIDDPGELRASSADFVAWADRVTVNADLPAARVLAARGSYLDLHRQLAAAEAGRRAAREDRKADLDLRATVSVGDRGDAWGDSWNPNHGSDLGGSVQIVYSRPLGFVAADARIEAATAVVDRLQARLREEEITIRAELERAEIDFAFARRRLDRMTAAVSAAQSTLEAERERFRLGEGRSRHVLDAQKDLTTAILLQTRNAAGVLRARANHRRQTGYADDPAWLVEMPPEE